MRIYAPGQPTRGLPDFPTRFGGSKLRLGPPTGDQVAFGSMAGHPPSGTVTFLLTDLEGSTRLWERDPEAMKAAMVRHDELLEKTIAAHGNLAASHTSTRPIRGRWLCWSISRRRR
jgi:hypothetical protein